VNVGIDRGFTGDLITDTFLKKIECSNTNYEYMIYYCGNNDIKHYIGTDEIIQNIHQFFNNFRRMFPNTKIIILSLLYSPENHRRNIIKQIETVNQSLQHIQQLSAPCHKTPKKLVKYININCHLSNGTNYDTDNVHLSPVGYAKLNDILRENILTETT